MDGIVGLADGIALELHRLLPRQRKTQRTGLALLVATMLDVRSANLMDLAAGLPRSVARIDSHYPWNLIPSIMQSLRLCRVSRDFWNVLIVFQVVALG